MTEDPNPQGERLGGFSVGEHCNNLILLQAIFSMDVNLETVMCLRLFLVKAPPSIARPQDYVRTMSTSH